MKRIKVASLYFLLLLFMSVFLSCRGETNLDKIQIGIFPKSLTITYRVTSPDASSLSSIKYKNETAGETNMDNVPLPFNKVFTKTINRNDVISLGYTSNSNANVKLEILVGSTVVKSQDFTANSGTIVYQFK